jgi:hypothetical protein
MLLIVEARAYPHQGDLLALTAEEEPTATVDLGAPYASTKPLIGPSVRANWKEARIYGPVPRSFCAPLAATVHRHTIWFKGSDESTTGLPKGASQGPYVPPAGYEAEYPVSSQQDAQRAFMHEVSSELCAEPQQSEDDYLGKLHAMLAKVTRESHLSPRECVPLHRLTLLWPVACDAP